MSRFTPFLIVALILAGTASAASARDFDVIVDLAPSGGGNFIVDASFGNGVNEPFLVDTGAGVSAITRSLFKRLSARTAFKPVRRIAARMADGRVKPTSVYSAPALTIGDQCEIGAVEFVIVNDGGRNILGMNALAAVAPVAIYVDPPALGISACLEQARADIAGVDHTTTDADVPLAAIDANSIGRNHD